jgi:hypothetical protein
MRGQALDAQHTMTFSAAAFTKRWSSVKGFGKGRAGSGNTHESGRMHALLAQQALPAGAHASSEASSNSRCSSKS